MTYFQNYHRWLLMSLLLITAAFAAQRVVVAEMITDET